MIKGRFLVLMAALIAAGPAVAAEPTRTISLDAAGMVFTADEKGNSISAVELATGRVKTVNIAISPHNVQVSPDGRWVYAVGDAAADAHGHDAGKAAGGRLLVIDTRNLDGVPKSYPVGAHPAHVVATPDGTRLLVTLAGENAVAVLDAANGKLLKRISTGRSPHGLRIGSDGETVYVANVVDGSISILNARTMDERARIPVGRAPVQVGFTPDAKRVYVSLRDENRVAEVDTSTHQVVRKIDVGRKPIQVQVTPDGRELYVANQGTETDPDDTVTVIDTRSGRVISTVHTGKGAHGVAISDDGRSVFITNIVAGTLSAIDTASRTVVGDYRVGRGPNGVTYLPAAP